MSRRPVLLLVISACIQVCAVNISLSVLLLVLSACVRVCVANTSLLLVLSACVCVCAANTSVSWEQFLQGDYPDYYEGQDPAFFVTSNNSAVLRERLGPWPWPPSTGIPPEYTEVDITRTNHAGLTETASETAETDIRDTTETDETSLNTDETEPPPKRPTSRTTTEFFTDNESTDDLRSHNRTEDAPVYYQYVDKTAEDTLANSLKTTRQGTVLQKTTTQRAVNHETTTQRAVNHETTTQRAIDQETTDTRLSTTEAEVQYFVYVDETVAVSSVSRPAISISTQRHFKTGARSHYATRSQSPVDEKKRRDEVVTENLLHYEDKEPTEETTKPPFKMGARSRYATRSQSPDRVGILRDEVVAENLTNHEDKNPEDKVVPEVTEETTEPTDCVPGPGKRPTQMSRPWTTMKTKLPPQYKRGHVFAKCFVCGMHAAGIPRNSHCADAFDHDMIKLTPVNPARGTLGRRMRMNCRFRDMFAWDVGRNITDRNEMYGLWTGGCSVRWVDIAPMYTQRTCRSRIHVPTGRSYLSQVFARMESALNDTDNGCIASPNAIMVPITRGITLYGRVHVCVCTGNFCNAAPARAQWSARAAVLSLLAARAI